MQTFKMPEPFSRQRFLRLAGIYVINAFLFIFFDLLEGHHIDTMIVEQILNLLFFAIFVYGVEHERLHRHLILGQANDLTKLTVFCAVACFLTGCSACLPEYCALFLLGSMLLNVTTNAILSVTYMGYLNVVFGIANGRTELEMAHYFMMIILTTILAQAFRKKTLFLPTAVATVGLSALSAQCFSYLGWRSCRWSVPISNATIALTAVVVVRLCYDKLYNYPIRDKQMACLRIIQEKYKLVQAIRRYSEVDFVHAKRVSQICFQCAQFIGADAPLAMAAGFYYRLGKLEGKPFVENGVKMAVAHQFPEEVVQILAEYNGEENLPSSIESAIVHMVDCIVTKMELIGEVNTAWNKEMMIYQTLNEKSSNGLYDLSKMSMNQFLKVREYLAKKEGLL